MTSSLQRSKFLKILQKNGSICLFHSISMRMVFGGLVLADLYEAFADAKTPQNVVNNFSDIYPVDLLTRVIDDLAQKGMLVREPCEDVRVYKKAYQKALNRYRIQHMYLFPTDACNFRCKYCFVEEDCRLQKPSFMDTSTAEMTLTSFARLSHESGHASVVFYGGEPLLNRETTFYCLRRLREMEADGSLPQVARISVLTNGSLIDNEAIRAFKDTMPNIGVSIDGPAYLHDAVRVDEHGRGTFSSTVAGYRRLQDAGINPGISCTLSSSTINYMDEIVDFIINDLKPRGMGFNLPLPLSNGNQPEQEFDHEFGVKQLIRAFKRLREAGIYEDRMMRRVRPFKSQQIHCKDCMGVGGQIVVTPTGRVGPCQAYLGLDDEKFFPLDVRQLAKKGSNLSAEDIYSNPLFGEWCQRFPLNMHQCADCFAISVCGGGCPYASDMTDGSIWEIDKRVCHQAQNILDWMIWETYEYAGELKQEKTGVNEKKNSKIPPGRPSTVCLMA